MTTRLTLARAFGVSASVAVLAGVLLNGRPYTAAAAAAAPAIECTVAALTALNVPNTTIRSATVVPAKAPNQQYCDVRGAVATNGDGAGPNVSGFQLNLPINWNGKFVYSGTRGTGGNLASAANQPDLEQFMVKGYASVTSDSGHTREPDWYYDKKPGVQNIPKLADAYYRSMHQVTGATKQVVKQFYGAQSIKYSYFERQGLPRPRQPHSAGEDGRGRCGGGGTVRRA